MWRVSRRLAVCQWICHLTGARVNCCQRKRQMRRHWSQPTDGAIYVRRNCCRISHIYITCSDCNMRTCTSMSIHACQKVYTLYFTCSMHCHFEYKLTLSQTLTYVRHHRVRMAAPVMTSLMGSRVTALPATREHTVKLVRLHVNSNNNNLFRL